MHSIMERGRCYTNLSDKNKLQRLCIQHPICYKKIKAYIHAYEYICVLVGRALICDCLCFRNFRKDS